MEDNAVKILITGDACPVHRLEYQLSKQNPYHILGDFQDLVKDSDLAITNLEEPLTNCSQPIEKTGPALKGSPECLSFFKEGGFDLFTLANNHIMDYGLDGLKETINHIDHHDLTYVGAGLKQERADNPYVKKFGALSVAILNFAENEWSTIPVNGSELVNKVDTIENFYQIQRCKRDFDKVIVITHGGAENYQLPTPGLKKRLRFYVDAGADAVINHHTHRISGYEEYKSKPIYYSLGNFLFDSKVQKDDHWFEGMAVELTLYRNSLKHQFFTFDQCKDEPVLRLHQGGKKRELNQRIESLNEIIKDNKKLKNNFNEFCARKHHLYTSYLEPYNNKYLHFLRKKGILPFFVKGRNKRLLLNLTRCESHREIVHNILLDEDSNT